MTTQIKYGYDDAMRTADKIIDHVESNGMSADEIKDGVILGSGLGGFADEHLEDYKNNIEILSKNNRSCS